jgi:hypothetical protein
VHRSLAVAAAAVPPTGAAALRLPPWVILLVAGTQLLALLILQLGQTRRQRQGHKGALKALRRMGSAALVTVDADGGFEVHRGPSTADDPRRQRPRPGSHPTRR